MKKCLINNNSNTLLVLFAGWGAYEYAFEHLKADFDVLILYDYLDLNLNFDFSKYKNFNLIGYLAGVFIASVLNFDFNFDKKIAISGNPYLFDERLGLSKEIQRVLCSITEETAEDFAKNYLIKTEKEYKNFHPSRRSIESCIAEFKKLKELYQANRQKIRDIYDFSIHRGRRFYI